VPLAALIDDPQGVLSALPNEPQRYHRDPLAFEYLLTRAGVDALIDRECLARQYLAVFKDGGRVDPRAYGTADQLMPRRGSMRQYLNDGHTVSLRGLQKLLPPIAGLCADVEQETGFQVHANAYYTPPGRSGLRYHYDPYVTLVVQLAGRKAWPVHPPLVENPVREHLSFTDIGFTDDQLRYLANTPPPLSYELEPGDVLWLPRGFVHAPHAVGDEPSLHLTLALKARTPHWLAERIVTDILDTAIRDPGMRAELAPSDLLDGTEGVVQAARDYLLGALLSMDTKQAAEGVRLAARHGTMPDVVSVTDR